MLKRDPKKLFLRYAQKGDAAALGKVFDLLAPELLGLAIHLTRRTELAEDVLQETFLAAAESAPRFDPARDFRPWLIGILVNRARKVKESIATSRMHNAGDEPLDAFAANGRGASPEDPCKEAEAEEIRTRVAAAIEQLKAPYREVVDAHVTGGLPPREIAPALGRAQGTVRVQLHRGLEQLRKRLASREGIAGLEMLSLAPTSAMVLSNEAGRGLAAIKAEILVSLPGTSTSVAGAAGGSTAVTGMAMAAAVVFLGTAAWIALRLTADDRSPEPSAVEVAAFESEDTVPPPNFAAVEDRDRLAPKRPSGAGLTDSRPMGTGDAKGRSTAKAPQTATPSGPKTERSPQRETYDFRIEPSIDGTAVDDFSAFATCRFHARSADRTSILGAGEATYNDFLGFSIGEFGSPLELPDPLILRFDHPNALPCEIALTARDWQSRSSAYVARPVLLLDKIEESVEVRGGTGQRGDAPGAPRFEGEALLFSFGAAGRAHVQDRQQIQTGHHEAARLRARQDLGEALIVGIPSSPNQFSDSVEVIVSGTSQMRAPAVMQPRLLPPIEVSVEDPFARPMGGLEIRATVPDELILLRDPETNKPWLFEGRAFCACDEEGVSSYGRLAFKGVTLTAFGGSSIATARSRPKVIALTHRVEGVTNGRGTVTLSGVVLGLHRFEAKSPVTGEWTQVTGQASGKGSTQTLKGSAATVRFELTPPVAGLEVESPSHLTEARTRWMSTKIRLSGYGFEATFKPQSGRHARALIPPDLGLMVEFEADDQRYSALTRPVAAGARQVVAPTGIKRRKGLSVTDDAKRR